MRDRNTYIQATNAPSVKFKVILRWIYIHVNSPHTKQVKTKEIVCHFETVACASDLTIPVTFNFKIRLIRFLNASTRLKHYRVISF